MLHERNAWGLGDADFDQQLNELFRVLNSLDVNVTNLDAPPPEVERPDRPEERAEDEGDALIGQVDPSNPF